jgi:hypothetical protein
VEMDLSLFRSRITVSSSRRCKLYRVVIIKNAYIIYLKLIALLDIARLYIVLI